MKDPLQVLYCPQCLSEAVKINEVDKSVERLSIDDLKKPERHAATLDVLMSYRYRAVCTYCGYSVEFTRSY